MTEQAATFVMGPAEVRKTLYAEFEVTEPVLAGQPIYLCICRRCGHIVATVPRVAEEIAAKPVLDALAHKEEHARPPSAPEAPAAEPAGAP